MAPRVAGARESAAEYADKVTPRMESAREAVTPRLEQAKGTVTPYLDSAKGAVTPKLGSAKEKVLPKVAGVATAALAATEPVREEAAHRGSATVAALKGELKPRDVRRARR